MSERLALVAAQVEPELLGGLEDVLVLFLELDLLAVSPMISTSRHSDCISLTRTLNDSGMPGSGMFSPLTMASYAFTRPRMSSDLIVRISCST